MSIDAFSEYFGELKDPRQTAKISYPLFDILFLTICAVIAGAEAGKTSRISVKPSSSSALFIGLNPSMHVPKVN